MCAYLTSAIYRIDDVQKLVRFSEYLLFEVVKKLRFSDRFIHQVQYDWLYFKKLIVSMAFMLYFSFVGILLFLFSVQLNLLNGIAAVDAGPSRITELFSV